jgi:hypothetical protein
MCSCSGSCNCNSTTIPRGPQGVPGPTGNTGAPGSNGNPGTPATIELGTVTTGAAGTDVIITNVGPDANNAEFNFTIPRGDQGIQGPEGIQGAPGPSIIDAIWAGNAIGTGGLNDKKASIYVPYNYMSLNDDALEVQAVFKVEDDAVFGVLNPLTCYIRILNTNVAAGSTILTQYGPVPYTGTEGENLVLEVDCKIQRTGPNACRVRAKWEISQGPVGSTYKNQITVFFTDITLNGVLSLSSPNTWANSQYIIASADDNTPPDVSAVHLEVRSIKRV